MYVSEFYELTNFTFVFTFLEHYVTLLICQFVNYWRRIFKSYVNLPRFKVSNPTKTCTYYRAKHSRYL